MNFHTFTYNEQMILSYVIMTILIMATIYILINYVFSKRNIIKPEIPWDDIMNWQTISLTVNSLVKYGELNIVVKDNCYTATLKSKLGFITGASGFELHKVLKSLDHETTMKHIGMVTKKGETNDQS